MAGSRSKSRSKSASKSRTKSRSSPKTATYKVGSTIKFYPFTKRGVNARIASIKTVRNPRNKTSVKIAYGTVDGKKIGRILPKKK